jgi:histone H3/H4
MVRAKLGFGGGGGHRRHNIPKASVQNAVKAVIKRKFGVPAARVARDQLARVVEHLGSESAKMAAHAKRNTIRPSDIAEAAKMMHKDCHGVDLHKVASASAAMKHDRSLPVAGLVRVFAKGSLKHRISEDGKTAIWIFAVAYLEHIAEVANTFAEAKKHETVQKTDIAHAIQL